MSRTQIAGIFLSFTAFLFPETYLSFADHLNERKERNYCNVRIIESMG